jgi:ribosomal protein S18 acetylase RimI-like enzyme
MYTYRQARHSEIKYLLPMLKTLFAIEKDFIFDENHQRQGLELLLSSNTATVFVALWENTVIGMVTGQLLISTAQGGPSLLVEDLVVNTHHRRKGIATQLTKTVCAWGAQNGANRIQLLADKNNLEGLRFYTKQNWQTTELICLRKFNEFLT